MSSFNQNYSKIYDALYHDKNYQEEVSFIFNLAKKFSSIPLDNLVEFASGTGNHAVIFSKLFKKIHLNDLSQEMLLCAKEKIQTLRSSDTFFSYSQLPMQDFILSDIEEKFSLGLSLYTALGYLQKKEDLVRFIQNLKTNLKPGGVFFCDLWNQKKMSKEFSPYRVKKIETAQYQIERVSRVEHFPDVESLEVNYDIHVHEKETQKEFNIQEKHLVKYHNPDAVADLFETCGLKVLEMGPYFDEATSIDQAWNFYLLAKNP